MAMFGGAVFLGQYFQIGRGYSPTEAGLLTIPMMGGVLISSTVSGRLITKYGRIKPYIIAGTLLLVAGFGLLGTVDHQTNLGLVGLGMFLVGTGVGMSMQNLVLVVQNSVALTDLGAASGAITFFRSLGGTIGVSVLGAVLANRVTDLSTGKLAAIGVNASAGGGETGTLDLGGLPAPIREIIRTAYGDATGRIFLIAAVIAVIGVIAALFLPAVTLRTTVDMAKADKDPVESTPLTEVAGGVGIEDDGLTEGRAQPAAK
jgi:MFS family permease